MLCLFWLLKWKPFQKLNTRCPLPHLSRYVCVLKRGYQDTDSVISSVTTKVKGIALTNTSDLGLRVWDVADYVIPPQVPPTPEEEVHGTPKSSTSWCQGSHFLSLRAPLPGIQGSTCGFLRIHFLLLRVPFTWGSSCQCFRALSLAPAAVSHSAW